jgi:Holliday junction DNA helicase RuvA
MYAYIKGILVEASPSSVVIDAGGVGYKIFVPASVFSRLPQVGSEAIIHTSFVVREQAQTLYGFTMPHERDFFESLLGVTGIGPKIALALIGHMPLGELQRAIVNEDIAAITRVPGIGKKGAERLIIEMRDKVHVPASEGNIAHSFAPSDPKGQMVNDAMSALINLGYNQGTAQKAIKKTLKDLPEGIDISTLIAHALKNV